MIKCSLIISILFFLAGCSNSPAERQDVNKDTDAGFDLNKSQEIGEKLYQQHCLACHMTDGTGVPGLFPPLDRTEMALGSKEELIKITLEGSTGPREVRGIVYTNVMPGFDFLSNEDLAYMLTYIRNNFGNDAGSISPDDIQEVRNSIGLK